MRAIVSDPSHPQMSLEQAAALPLAGLTALRLSRAESVDEAHGPFGIGGDSVGGRSTAAVLSRLEDRGLLPCLGQASRQPPSLNFLDWRGGANATIRKFLYAADDDRRELATLVRLVATGRLHPEIGLLAKWSSAQQAVGALLGREVRGKVVLTIDHELSTAKLTKEAQ